MQKLKINLNLVSEVQEFIKVVGGIDCDIDVARDRYIIDAKSIIGVFTIDLSKPVDLIIYSDDTSIAEKFSKWVVK